MLIISMIFVLGLFVGSFLNVVVLRLHAGKNFVKGRSECPKCKRQLGPMELIPVLSWLVLRGRCKHCRKPISPQYPLVELTTGLVFAMTAATLTLGSALSWLILALWLYIAGSLIVLAVYDLKWYLLPDKVLLPLILPALAILVINAATAGSWHPILAPILAALVAGGAFYLLAWASKGAWMGGGDIKLVFVMGLLLGAQKLILALFIGFNTAAIVAIWLLVTRRKGRGGTIPFGPFLILGTFISLWWGTEIINWYLNLTGLNLL